MALLSSYLTDFIEQNIPVFVPADTLHTTACVAASAAAAIGAVLGALLVSKRTSYRNYDPDEYGEQWNGYKRTLLVFVAFILLLPVAEAVACIESRYVFSSAAWSALTGSESKLYSSWWSSTLLFSAIARGLLLVLSCVVVALLLLRRRAIRWAVPLYIGASIVIGGVQNFLYTQIFVEGGEAIRQQHFDRVAGLMTLLLMVVPYLWFSKRIHATFRR